MTVGWAFFSFYPITVFPVVEGKIEPCPFTEKRY
jgi:hypothetical protein